MFLKNLETPVWTFLGAREYCALSQTKLIDYPIGVFLRLAIYICTELHTIQECVGFAKECQVTATTSRGHQRRK